MSKGEESRELVKSDRRKPLLLGEYDKDVHTYVKYFRNMGGVVNIRIIIGAAKGIMKRKNRNLLVEHGGQIEL